jgi:MFS family permease
MIIIPSIWLSLWNALIQVGAMLGSLINAPLTDRLGRKFTFAMGGAIACIATAVIYISDRSSSIETRRSVFLGGKIILGVALGMLLSTCQTYISEVVPPRIRGPCLSFFTFFLVMGQLIAVSIVFGRILIFDPSAYRVCFASQWAFAVLAVIVGILIPESPVYLVKRGKLEQAEKSYALLHSRAQAPAAIAHLKTTIEAEELATAHQASATYLECFKRSDWRRTRIVCYSNILQQCLGVTLLANSTYFLELGGMTPTHALLVTQIAVGIGLVANVSSWFTMTAFGRKPMLIISTGACGALWLAIGIAGCWPGSSQALWYDYNLVPLSGPILILILH